MHMLYGNHDIIKRRRRVAEREFRDFYCNDAECKRPLFPGIKINESIVLKDVQSGKKILLIDGHQGQLFKRYHMARGAFSGAVCLEAPGNCRIYRSHRRSTNPQKERDNRKEACGLRKFPPNYVDCRAHTSTCLPRPRRRTLF